MVSLALLQLRTATLDVPSPPRIPTQCEPYTFNWSGGTPPYIFSVISPHPPPISVFSGLADTSFTWTADISASFSLSFKVEDSTGSFVQTSAVTMRRGLDDSCLDDSGGAASQSTSTSPDTTQASPTLQSPTSTPSTSSSDTTGVATSDSPLPASPS
ncbi:hypothetical protein BC628DRAFT_1333195, partial [Trametes gibbosa]